MDEKRPIAERRCAAMITAGIYDPNSKDGIDFCTNFCPYECCVVMEQSETAAQLRRRQKADFARKLRARRVSVNDIALILGVNLRTVFKWLKE